MSNQCVRTIYLIGVSLDKEKCLKLYISDSLNNQRTLTKNSMHEQNNFFLYLIPNTYLHINNK
jgi:hypothetical protein